MPGLSIKCAFISNKVGTMSNSIMTTKKYDDNTIERSFEEYIFSDNIPEDSVIERILEEAESAKYYSFLHSPFLDTNREEKSSERKHTFLGVTVFKENITHDLYIVKDVFYGLLDDSKLLQDYNQAKIGDSISFNDMKCINIVRRRKMPGKLSPYALATDNECEVRNHSDIGFVSGSVTKTASGEPQINITSYRSHDPSGRHIRTNNYIMKCDIHRI